jgi:hypothetical protein
MWRTTGHICVASGWIDLLWSAFSHLKSSLIAEKFAERQHAASVLPTHDETSGTTQLCRERSEQDPIRTSSSRKQYGGSSL